MILYTYTPTLKLGVMRFNESKCHDFTKWDVFYLFGNTFEHDIKDCIGQGIPFITDNRLQFRISLTCNSVNVLVLL